MKALPLLALAPLALAGCGGPGPHGPERLGRDEVLVQISASGEAEAKPNEARFSAGVSSIGATAGAATAANNEKMNAVVAALKALGVAEADIQTQRLTVSRVEWGPNRNRFDANNVVSVRMRDVTKAGAAIAATTQAGANILSGPDLRVGDPETASRAAYAAAYKAARARADAYAEAAGLKVARVLTIRDGGMPRPPMPYDGGMGFQREVAQTVAPPPVMAGTSSAQVTVSVDFALAAK